jgi:hypothetical protein
MYTSLPHKLIRDERVTFKKTFASENKACMAFHDDRAVFTDGSYDENTFGTYQYLI